jgi:hypothetical protein
MAWQSGADRVRHNHVIMMDRGRVRQRRRLADRQRDYDGLRQMRGAWRTRGGVRDKSEKLGAGGGGYKKSGLKKLPLCPPQNESGRAT